MESISIEQVKVSAIICTAVAVLATVSRLIIKRNALGIDDIWVFLAITAMCIKLGLICNLSCMFTQGYPTFSLTRPLFLDTNIATLTTYYTILVTFYTTLWFSRIAVLFSLIRVAPERHQRVMYFIFAIFLTTYILLIGQTVWVCESQLKALSICMPNREMAIFEILGDAFADLSLVGISLNLFTIIQERALRYRLMCIFSTCIGTTVVSLIHGLYILRSGVNLEVLVIAIVEATVSTIVANIPVLSTFFINLFPSLRSPSGHSRQNSINSFRISSLSLRITRGSACGSHRHNNSPRHSHNGSGHRVSSQTRTAGSIIVFERPEDIATHHDVEWNSRRVGDHPLISTRRETCLEMELELNSRHPSSQDLKYDASSISYPPKCL
ncbi:hypothetical protein BJ165DRAFT_408193 [Panaeolus papilionaceus]|nr:hypothetical protein BJ165DRAFT_408193 [Panaeolus papilionaceus]